MITLTAPTPTPSASLALTQSPPSYDDSPIVALLEANPSTMSREELLRYVSALRDSRQNTALRAKLTEKPAVARVSSVRQQRLAAIDAELKQLGL